MATTDLQRANAVLHASAKELGKEAVDAAIGGVTEAIQSKSTELARAIPSSPSSAHAKELAEAVAVVLTTQDPASRSFRLWSVFWMLVGLVATSTDVQDALSSIVGMFWAEGVSYLPFVISIASVLYSKYKDQRLSAS